MVQVINALNSNNFGIIIDLATILKKNIHPGAECSEDEKEGGAEKKPPGFEIILEQDAK